MAELVFGSVCSGIEAASMAWGPLGWRAAFFSEIDKFASAVLAHRHPTVPNLGDMTRFKDWPDAAIDVLAGGTPCQSYSNAGLRAGLDDPRGQLMLTYGAVAARYRPKWLVWENVPGVLSSNGGRDFLAFGGNNTSGPIDVSTALLAQPGSGWRGDFESETFIAHTLRGDGFDASEDGSQRGTPLVAAFDTTQVTNPNNRSNPQPGGPCHTLAKGAHAPAIAFHGSQDPHVSDDVTHPVGRNQGQETCVFQERGRDQGRVLEVGGDVAYALTAPDGGGRAQERNVLTASVVRRLTPRECERLQGFPDDYTLIPWRGKPASECPDGPRYKALGNSWAVNCPRWIARRINLVEQIHADRRVAA